MFVALLYFHKIVLTVNFIKKDSSKICVLINKCITRKIITSVLLYITYCLIVLIEACAYAIDNYIFP